MQHFTNLLKLPLLCIAMTTGYGEQGFQLCIGVCVP